jgi:hypothetical protein
MFPFERFIAVLKKCVRNHSRPEGCIAKGHGTEEVIEFCVDFKNIGYKEEPFVLAKDVTQVFYVKNMSSKPKKDMSSKSKNDEPKRHIVLPGKGKIIGVEDISDKSEDFDQFDDLPPFSVDVDPGILFSKEDTPYLRGDHNQGMFIKRKIINIQLNNDE